MGSYWLNGGQISGTLNYSFPVNIWDEERDYRYLTRGGNIYQLRLNTIPRNENPHFLGWTFGSFIDPDSTIGLAPITGQEQQNIFPLWEPWQLGESGWSRPLFIRGICTNASGGVVSGAKIESYISATGALDGITTTAPDGSYGVPCTNSGAHYVTAYLSGSPDIAGISVNTLIPSV